MDNPYAILVVILVAVVVVVAIKISSGSERRKVLKNNKYSYYAKDSIMTRAETEVFKTLYSAVNERYLVFPQVHLSALLDHRIKGQDWRIAFRHINGKSVDFVLCDKLTLRPTYALELDDFTHNQRDRVERDIEVERIFKEARLPLIRFKNADATSDEIIQALISAKKMTDA